jgi:23S rRNA pseudouridine2605 synthase
MKKYNNSQSGDNKAGNSQKPVRRSKPGSDTAKPKRTSFRRAVEDSQDDGFSKKPRVTRARATNDLGERPALKRRTKATDEARPFTSRRKSPFSDKAANDDKPFERRTPKGKGAAAKRNFDRKDTEDTARRPSPRTGKFSGENRDSREISGRRSRSINSRTEKRDFTESKSKPFKKVATEERPQKRSDREGYYTGKKKAAPGSVTKQTPDYNFKSYEQKKTRGKETKPVKEDKDTTRLNRYIANAGICSRREADKLIESGEIKVNGKVVTEMGYQVLPNDIVKYGNRVLNKEKLVYVLLNKPKGYITTTDDPEERKTVMDLVSNACDQRIYPVGRLDRNTSGLLLFTNDGELAEKLAHPSNDIKKIYQVELDKPITKEDFQQVADGVQLEDGLATVDEVAIITPDKITLGVEIHIGRNRIVRRIFEHLGYEVIKLDRVSYAGLTKKDLPRGNWRFLSEKEVIKLKYFV